MTRRRALAIRLVVAWPPLTPESEARKWPKSASLSGWKLDRKSDTRATYYGTKIHGIARWTGAIERPFGCGQRPHSKHLIEIPFNIRTHFVRKKYANAPNTGQYCTVLFSACSFVSM